MEKKTILVIEDNEINRQFIIEILKEEYNILSAKDGKEGLDLLKKKCQSISAILLDIQMPVMNGYEFLEIVSQNAVYSKIPILVNTVLDNENDEKRCLELGAVDFIVKPYDPLIVKLRIRNTIFLRECSGLISELEKDALTGFRTRKAYYNDIETIEQNTEKSMHPMGVVFADVNGLKEINDSKGHEAGDELIAAVAKNISAIFPDAKRYRFGGDEFVILSFEESRDTFNTKLQKLSDLWGEDYSAAVGSVWLEHAKDLEKNVAVADKMMYIDKSRYYERRMQERRIGLSVDTEETLKKMEEVSELLPGGFFVYHADEEERLITYNREMLRLFKCKDDKEFIQHIGNSFKGMVHPEDIYKVECDISSQIKKERDIDRVKYRIICKDGSVRRVLDYGRFVHTEMYGDVYYVFMNDITDEE